SPLPQPISRTRAPRGTDAASTVTSGTPVGCVRSDAYHSAFSSYSRIITILQSTARRREPIGNPTPALESAFSGIAILSSRTSGARPIGKSLALWPELLRGCSWCPCHPRPTRRDEHRWSTGHRRVLHIPPRLPHRLSFRAQ